MIRMVTCERGHPIDEPCEDRRPCPVCGSPVRHVTVQAEDRLLEMRSSLKMKVTRASGKVAQVQTVDAPRRSADGTWPAEYGQVFEYEADPPRYREHVVTAAGEVHDEDHPLDQHRGRGSDKPELRAKRQVDKEAAAQADIVDPPETKHADLNYHQAGSASRRRGHRRAAPGARLGR